MQEDIDWDVSEQTVDTGLVIFKAQGVSFITLLYS